MKQVIARAGKVVVADVPEPVRSDDGVLVRNSYSVISSGTESWSIDSTDPLSTADLVKDSSLASKAIRLSREVLRQEGVSGLLNYVEMVRHPEVPLGYSCAGVVLEVGRNVRDIVVGDKVACAGEGKACHAEVVCVPRNLLTKVEQGVSLKSAAFATIGAIAVHAVRTSGVQFGEAVGVVGAGLVGNLVAQIARAAGCKVVCIDLRDDRLALVKELGADLTLRSEDPALASRISHFTRGRGLDHVLVCAATSSSDPLNLAGRLARNRGSVVVVGRVGMDIDRKDFYQKELKLLMSRSLGPGRYDPVYEEKGVDYPVEYVRWTLNRNMEAFLDLLGSGRVNADRLVAREFPLQEAPQAYQSLGSQTGVALVLAYPTEVTVERPRSEPIPTPRPVTGRINVAVVGPGGFAKETIIPILRSNSEFALRWVVSSNPLHATQVAKRFGFERSTCDLAEALSDPELHAVIISSPNNLHYPMLAQAMKAGKLSFVEKPLCLTREEFEQIKKLHEQYDLPVVVGFNRRYAPLVQKMKERMRKMDGPFVINYRLNAGFTPASKWYQDPQIGGGRIIHECCHFFDLFNYLLGHSEPEIVARSAGVNNSTSVARDNLSVVLKYGDGSLANLVYVSLGDKRMERERIEVFGQGQSMVLSDFKELSIFGEKNETLKLNAPDKGHRQQFEEFAKFVRGAPSSLISSEEVFDATELTFKVDEAVRKAWSQST